MSVDYIVLLREAVRTSGLTAEKYAHTVLMRNPRSLRRWLDGSSPIPTAVRDYLDRLVKPGPLEEIARNLDDSAYRNLG